MSKKLPQEWTLSCGSRKIALQNSHIFGRTDFPEFQSLSRQHFKISMRGDRPYVEDLGATNGTTLNGKKLAPNSTVELKSGDVLRAAEVIFNLSQKQSEVTQVQSTLPVDIGLFLVLSALALATRYLAFDTGLELYNVFISLAVLFSITLFTASLWNLVLDNLISSSNRLVPYSTFVAATVLLLYSLLVPQVGKLVPSGRVRKMTKVEYACLNNFRRSECVRQLHLCPACALQMDEDDKKLIIERLAAFRSEYPISINRPVKNLACGRFFYRA